MQLRDRAAQRPVCFAVLRRCTGSFQPLCRHGQGMIRLREIAGSCLDGYAEFRPRDCCGKLADAGRQRGSRGLPQPPEVLDPVADRGRPAPGAVPGRRGGRMGVDAQAELDARHDRCWRRRLRFSGAAVMSGRRIFARLGGCCRARRRQRVLDRVPHRLVHLAPVAKAHLDLGRMHVDVDPGRIDLDEQRVGRLALAVQHVLVGAARRVRDHLVAHEASVDIGELAVRARTRRVRQAGAAPDTQALALPVQRQALGDEVLAQHVAQALRQRRLRVCLLAGAPLLDQPALVPDREADIGPRERVAAHRLQAMREFGRIALEELAPRRRGVEQLAHLDRRAMRACGGRELAGAAMQHPGMAVLAAGLARQQADVGDRVDGRQRLAPEAHGMDRFELGQVADLAGCVALERGAELLARDAAAVVLDRDQPHAAREQAHRDLARAGIERIVDQLAHHRRRALDHLAGGDLADQLVGQFADRSARCARGGFGLGAWQGIHPRIVGWQAAGCRCHGLQ